MVKALAALILGLCFALPTFAATAEKKQPDWSQLTPEQQQILAPLSSDWNNWEDRRRKKWLLLAKRYPKMKPDEQQRVQTQMRDWVKLTPEQRRIARENYKKLAKQPPEKREAVKQKWQERQQKAVPSKSAAPSTADQSADKAASPPSPANPPR
jgi:hypothetical protein